MRIVIDGRSINKGGIGSILLGILENLDYSKNHIAVLGDKKLLEPLNLPFKIIQCKSKAHTFFSFINPNLAKDINTYDCYFTPDYVIPRGITINSYCLFHDMLAFDNRKHNHRIFTDLIKRIVIRRSYRVAKKVFTISNFLKDRIELHLGKKKEVIVLNPGVSNVLTSNIDKPYTKKNYYVYVGSAKNHKNLNLVINALKKLKWKYPLHIITQSENTKSIDKKTLFTITGNPYIIILNDLTPEEYAKELKEARGLIQPSSFEGFGTQIMEALSFNTPAIISDIPVFKEIYKDENVYYFSKNNEEELIKLLDKEEFSSKGLSREFKEKHDNKKLTETLEKSFEKTIKKSHVRRNFIFNVIYQVLVVLTPLITAPYVSRVLGASNIGMFSFAYTIAYYFIIFGYLGFQQYAQRKIAETQNDKEEQSRVFWQIVISRTVPVIISVIVLLILFFSNVFGAYSNLILIFLIIVGSTAFDINFYFHGKENFFVVMLINIAIRVGFLFLIFNLVKTRYDLKTYTLLYSLMVAGGYLTMWIMLPTNLKRVKLNGINFINHMKGSLSLFLPVAAVSIYALIDKTLIGLLVTGRQYIRIGNITTIAYKADVENGLYYQAERVIKALSSILLAYGTVMTTRNSIEYSNNKKGMVKLNVYKAFNFVFALGVPLVFGTLVVADCFIPMFYGQGYDGAIQLLMMLSPIILFTGISNIIGMQYLLPTKRDKQYSIAVLIGFGINIVCNLIFIPLMQYVGQTGATGAVIGTLISEFIIAFIEFIFVRKELSIKIILECAWKYIVAGAIMWVVCYAFYFYVLTSTTINNLTNLIILIPSGIVIYYLSLMILRDKMIFRYTKYFFVKIGDLFKKDHKIDKLESNAISSMIINNRSTKIREMPQIINIKDNKDEKE